MTTCYGTTSAILIQVELFSFLRHASGNIYLPAGAHVAPCLLPTGLTLKLTQSVLIKLVSSPEQRKEGRTRKKG